MQHPTPRELPRVLHVSDAAIHGLTRAAVRHAIRRYRWRPLARGFVLTVADAPTRHDWAVVGLRSAGPHAALSGWDAVRESGLGARRPSSTSVLVLDTSGTTRALGGVLIRPTIRRFSSYLLPGEHPTLPYARIADPARAVADTALLHRTFDPVRALVTSAVQRKVCTPAELVAEYEAGPRQHSHWLRLALQDVAGGAKSIAEAEAVQLLTGARVPTFEVNVPLVDVHGRLVAEADVLWRALRLIVEVDGREFHLGETEWNATNHRHRTLSRHHLAIEHHSPSEIRSGGAAWADGIAEAARARSVELGLPYVPGRGPLPVPPGGHRPYVLE